MATPPQKPQGQPKPAESALGAGLTFATVIVLFTFGGRWLDGALGTSPWFLLVGILLGLVGGTIHLLVTLAPGALPFGRKPTGHGRADAPADSAARPPARSRTDTRPHTPDEPPPPVDDGQPR